MRISTKQWGQRNFQIPLSPFLCLYLCLCGCAHFSSEQQDTLPDQTIRTTRVHITTFFDAHSDLAKLRASSTDKTQGLTISGLDQSASGTNAVEILRAVTDAAVSAAIKSTT